MLSKMKCVVMPAMFAAISATVFAAAVGAQVQTSTDTTAAGTATQTSKVERGEVVYVSGNDLVVKTDDGQIRHFPNVPDSVRITVDGQQLSVHDLKVGMKVQRTITTTTTPQLITTVKTVKGKVWHVSPPNSVILTLEDGKNQEFKIPNNQKFVVNGETLDAFGLRPGMVITATKIVEVPENVVTQQRKITGTMPPAPPSPPADQPLLVATSSPKPAPAPAADTTTEVATAQPPAKLPKTGSPVPLIGLLGLVSLMLSLGIRIFRGMFATRFFV
jgi:LPXTG-motif cell wall-anchored protein